MSRSQKTWGSSKNALQNRVQQSRIARQEVRQPGPQEFINVRSEGFEIHAGISPIGRSRLNGFQPGQVIIRDAHFPRPVEMLVDIPQEWLPTVAEMNRFHNHLGVNLGHTADVHDSSYIRGPVPSRIERRKARKDNTYFIDTVYAADAPLNPINVDELTERLYLAVLGFVHQGSDASDGTYPLINHYNYTLEERDKYKKQLRQWCKYLIRKVFAANKTLHHPVLCRTNEVGVVQVSSTEASLVDLQGNKDISKTRTQLRAVKYMDKWAKEQSVYTDPTQRPTLLNIDEFVRPDSRIFLVYPKESMHARIVFHYSKRTRDPLIEATPGIDGTVFGWVSNNPFNNPNPNPNNYMLHILRCAVGFLMNKVLTRPWSDFDLVAYGCDINAQFPQEMLRLDIELDREVTGSNFYPLGEFYGKPFVLVPLLQRKQFSAEGRMMRHCVNNYAGVDTHRYYSIREATYVDGKLVPGRPRVTFNLAAKFDTEKLKPQFCEDPVPVPLKLISSWAPQSAKGIRNMNNPKWVPLMEAAGKLLGQPDLAKIYIPTSGNYDGS